MRLPEPVPGLVIRYSYLRREEHLRGQEEGTKDRPCAIILVTTTDESDKVVTVLPVSHAPPKDPALAVEIPPPTKARLGLDDDRSWVVLTEANRFIWPSPDLRPTTRGDAANVAYGLLPAKFYAQLVARFLQVYAARRASVVPRTE